jgi:predicted transcriptional regulator
MEEKSIPEVLFLHLTSEQIRAARMLLRWEQKDLAEASGISLPSIKRLETQPGKLGAQYRTIEAIVRALEKAGVTLIPENGGGAGVRLARRVKRSK